MLMKLIIDCALLNWPSFNWQYIEYLLSLIVIKSTMQLILFWILVITEVTRSFQSYYLLRKRKEIYVCIIQIKDQTLYKYFQYQCLSPSSPRVLWLTPGSRVRTVLCSLRFLCCLGPQSLLQLQPRVTADLHRHKHRSIIKKERWRHFPHLIFTTAPLTQATAARLLTTPCSVYTLLIATFSRHIVTAGSGPGSEESQDTAWERDSVSEASSCCLLRNLHGYIWYCQTLTRPWLSCSKGRNLLKCFTWNKKSINLKCSR